MKTPHLLALALILAVASCNAGIIPETPGEENTQEEPEVKPEPEPEKPHDPLEDPVPNPYSYIVGGEQATGERIRMEHPGIANPERGLRFEMLVGIEEGDQTENKWPFEDYTDDGVVIAQAYCYLTRYFDSPIAQSKLDALQKSFDRARRDGVKFLLRFAYQDDANKDAAPDLDRLMEHIEQLTPIVRQNIDVIYVLQIGWIGMWGEFHSDPYNYNNKPEAIARIAKATLDMLPQSHSTMMRTIGYRKKAFKGADELGISLDALRIGFFNDGTLANSTDGGTFTSSTDRDKDFNLVSTLGSYFPVDGECYWNSVATYHIATGMKAIQRFYKHHYTTFSVVHGNSELERHIYGPVDCWKSVQITPDSLRKIDVPVDDLYYTHIPHPNAYEYIRDHLGYRINVTSYSAEIQGNSFSGEVVLRNTGFSRPVNPRKIYLVLFDEDGSMSITDTGVDVQRLMPWNDIKIQLSANAPSENCRAALWMPDMEESVKMRPEYSISLVHGVEIEVRNGYLLNILK